MSVDAEKFHWTQPKWDAKTFKTFKASFKIPAVLSDGQWYDVPKLRHFTGETEGSVRHELDVLMRDDGGLVVSANGSSYRMSCSRLLAWRAENGLEPDRQLIPSILYPRFVITHDGARYTEAEVFETVPLHRFGQVRFIPADPGVVPELMGALHTLGRFTQDDSPGRWRLTCLAADVGKRALERYAASADRPLFADKGSPSIYNTGRQRDINEFRRELIEPVIRFYQTFRTTSAGQSRPAILQPSSYRTLLLYADDGEGSVISQLNKWIITAIQHYDETSGIPFAAYLNLIVNRRVNDIPGMAIGRGLSKFQNRKARAIKYLNRENPEAENPWYSDDEIRSRMRDDDPGYDLSRSEYERLDSQLHTWQQMHHASSLQWEETGEEKARGAFDMSRQLESMGGSHDRERSLSRIEHAVIHAGVDSGDARSARLMLDMLAHSSTLGAALLSELSGELSDAYRESLSRALGRDRTRMDGGRP